MKQQAASIITRFAGLSRIKALCVLAMLTIAMVAVLLVSPGSPGLRDTVPAPGGGDMMLYESIVARMRAGEDYYAAAHSQLLDGGYGTQSVFNWRLPTLSFLLSLAPSLLAGQLVQMLLAVLAGSTMGVLLHRMGGWPLAGPGALLMMFSLAGALTPGSVLLSEMPAGVLILLSAALYGLGRWRWGMAAGFAALLIRELAGVYIIVCLFLAWRNRRWNEVAAWFFLLCAYGLYFAWHYCHVQMQIGVGDPAYADGWLQFGGLGFLVATAAFNGYFALLPGWANALLLPLAALGLLAWPGRSGLPAVLMVGAALVLFAVVGKPFNTYWGALYTPLLTLGLAWLPWAVVDLGRSAMGKLPGLKGAGLGHEHPNVDAYVAALPDGVDAVFQALRDTVRALVPQAEETMRYDMPCWRLDGTTIIHAAAWKRHIGLYPVYRGDADFELAIGPYRDKKDTVKLLYSQPMPFDVIERIIRARLSELETRP